MNEQGNVQKLNRHQLAEKAYWEFDELRGKSNLSERDAFKKAFLRNLLEEFPFTVGANPDREIWVKNQVLKAIRSGVAINKIADVRADEQMYKNGIDGIAEGATIEIHNNFGVYNFINLKMK